MKNEYVQLGLFLIIGTLLLFVFVNKYSGKNTGSDGSASESNDSINVLNESTGSDQNMLSNSVRPKYVVTLKTSKGDIAIELNTGQTPKTVDNFVTLAKKGFYNNTIFHRIVEGFMIQGGDPNGDGTGGPGYTFDDEPFTGEYTRGAVAMANRGKNTNGSQFFIMHQDKPLSKDYVIFGHVVSGMEVVDAIAADKVAANLSGENSKPVIPTTVLNAEVKEL